jgi:hypothetical protein
MNYYGSRRRYYRNRARAYRSYGRSSRYSSSSTRRAAGNYRAALQQRDQSSVNLSIPTSISVTTKNINITNPFLPDGSQQFTIENGGVTAINIWDLLRKSSFYQSYASMYDQVKIDRIRVKLTPSSFVLSGSRGQYSNYTVVTAWDRSGLSDEQLTVNTPNRYDATFGNGTSEGNRSYGVYVNMTASDISSYSSAVTKPVNAGANSSIIRSLYPRTTQEKGLYVNTSDIDEWYSGIGENNNFYGVRNAKAIESNAVTIVEVGGDQGQVPVYGTMNLIDSKAVSRNPAFIGECPTLPWKPTLLVGLLNKPYEIEQEGGTTVTITPSMNLYVEADIGVSFRGLRKAPIVA